MSKNFSVLINNKIKKFNKTIFVEGDKSISHRALIIGSQCFGLSKINGILESEDVKNTIVCLRKLGVKIIKKKKLYLIYGNGLGSFKNPPKNELYAGNSGTLARMLIGILATQPSIKVKIFGDSSLNKRDMKRVIEPLSRIGCNFYPKNKTTLPIILESTNIPLAQKHIETLGSAQVKSAILFAALNIPGVTKIEEKKISRNHTENLLFKIKADIKVKKFKTGNLIFLNGKKNLFGFNYNIPGDPSSAAPFVILTLLSNKSKLVIKNVNCNPTRLGFIKILKKMNANIKVKNLKKKSGELVGNLVIKSSILKPINCSKNLVPFSIDEFPLLFIAASTIKGISKFNGIGELRHKESDRVKSIETEFKKMGIKTKSTANSLIIYGNPKPKVKKTLNILSRKDHRIAMSFFCLGQILDCKLKIQNFETVNTSFSKFLSIMKQIGAKFEIEKTN